MRDITEMQKKIDRALTDPGDRLEELKDEALEEIRKVDGDAVADSCEARLGEFKEELPGKTRKETGGMEMLAMAMIMGSDNAIYHQEKCGQTSFVNSVDLPTRILGGTDEQLTKMGIKLGEPYEDDKIFRPVELPEGWHKESTDHSMHSNLLDDKGRKRVSIFYKAAWYDRSAHMGLEPRFKISRDWSDEADSYVQCRVLDCGEPIFETDRVTKVMKEDGREDYGASDAVEKQQMKACDDYLAEHWPNWQDVTAYWD
jgi:hypothetical protein